MPSDYISFKDTNYFSNLICDYLDRSKELNSFYNRFPSLDNFKLQIEEKSKAFNNNSRLVLHNVLKSQYQNTEISEQTSLNIDLLKFDNTFTITTGHQLNLFTGPLYFLYKIISTINLTQSLKERYPEYNFVPVYWMATEDHDFEEINYFNFEGKKVQWNKNASGAVGRLSTEGLENVFKVFSSQLEGSLNAKKVKSLFEKAYIENSTLAEATHFLANALFGELGLVIIDADHKALKEQFIPYLKNDILENKAQNQIEQSNSMLKNLGYNTQVNPREINLFYLGDNYRERIITSKDAFKTHDSKYLWTKSEIITELENHPERFSPNVIVRPLYQEVILPNLCYIGGGGELAYWLQLKSYFKSEEVTFPILLLRNSVLIISSKQKQKLEKLDLTYKDIFKKQNELVNQYVKDISQIKIDFTQQKEHLNNQFKELYEIAKQTDQSFVGAVGAQERKQIKGLEHLEKRLLKAQKRKLKDKIERITDLQNQLFPLQSLQERNANFSELYLKYGEQLIQQLVLNLQPLKSEFLILEL